jgi:hypothetical protein
MKVIMIATGEIAEVNESYGARLIEQGKAVMAPAKKEAPKPQLKAEEKAEPKPEKKRAKE